ncbi:DUF2117 domain-containing protein [Methanolobus sp. ZRKC4]|uniref:DUF2117 family protein n=1 Tax=Methanolobus sp. ZRKC4 TaxID=3125787 RepID=UPI003247D392
MEIGIVIHGPDVVDSGMAKIILDKLNDYGNISAIMAGTIGKTAVLDAHLEDIIDIRKSLKPSRCIEEFFKTKDIVILLNHGKTTNNGIIFANIVVSKLIDRNIKPFIHIERPGSPDGKIVPWNSRSIDFALEMAKVTELKITDVPDLIIPISVEDHNHRIIRNVYGVHIGEKIMVNGIIVGFAQSEDIQIVTENGFIKNIKGAKVKEHGLEKLHRYEQKIPIDLNACWVKSGSLRGNNFSVRKNMTELKYILNEEKNSLDSGDKIKAVIIDHEAERSFELVKCAQVAVTIGDDTTDLAGDILYRLKIPIIGITDGDIDGFSHNKHIYPGSTVLRLKPGYDDIIGKEIKNQVFNGKESAYFNSINILKNKIFAVSKECSIFRTDY